MNKFEPGSPYNVELHSELFSDLKMCGLLITLAVIAAGSKKLRIATTIATLKEAESRSISKTLPTNQQKTRDWFNAIRDSLSPLGLIDPSHKTWKEDRLKVIDSKDKTSVRAVLENGRNVLLTSTPSTLPHWLKGIGVTVSTPKEFLLAIGDAVPNEDDRTASSSAQGTLESLLMAALWDHREATGRSDSNYDSMLYQLGLEPLARKLPRRN